MPKKILLESTIHQFVSAGHRCLKQNPTSRLQIEKLIDSLTFSMDTPGEIQVQWGTPSPGQTKLLLNQIQLYFRGDTPAFQQKQSEMGMDSGADPVMQKNQRYFDEHFQLVLKNAGISYE